MPNIANIARRGLVTGYRALHAMGLDCAPSAPVAYVMERADWAIQWVGRYLAAGIEARHPGLVALTTHPERLNGRIAHFGSQFQWGLWADMMAPSNQIVVTYYHGKPEDSPEMARHIDQFLGKLDQIDRVVTAASPVEQRLLDWGVPREKLVRIPLGVDTELFQIPTPEQRLRARLKMGVPEGAVCIGSFQKDGVGWDDGAEPKLIKGPDIFIEAVARLAGDFQIFVLLTGPARGYVKKGLEDHGVPYHHEFVDDFRDIAACYHALDLYLVTAREEGGPNALLESMASGVPLVATRTGMADDVIEDGVNARLARVDDVDGIVGCAQTLLTAGTEITPMQQAGRQTAEQLDWSMIAEKLHQDVYRGLLE